MKFQNLNEKEQNINNLNEKKNNKSNPEENEINMIIKISENDLYKDIYFLDNIDDEKDEIKIKSEHNKLTEMNETNTDLYVNNIKYKFQKFFIFDKIGNYDIKIKLKFLI